MIRAFVVVLCVLWANVGNAAWRTTAIGAGQASWPIMVGSSSINACHALGGLDWSLVGGGNFTTTGGIVWPDHTSSSGNCILYNKSKTINYGTVTTVDCGGDCPTDATGSRMGSATFLGSGVTLSASGSGGGGGGTTTTSSVTGTVTMVPGTVTLAATSLTFTASPEPVSVDRIADLSLMFGAFMLAGIVLFFWRQMLALFRVNSNED